MSKEIKSKKFEGVYYRNLENGDRSYFLRMRINGKTTRVPIGKKSEGINEAFCAAERIRIINENKFGEVVADKLRKVKREDPTFAQLIDYYLVTAQIKESTANVVKVLYKVPFANSKQPTREEIQNYVDEQARKYKTATVQNRYRQIRSIYNFAINRGKYRRANPCDGVVLPKGKVARQRYFKPEEVQQLLEAVKDKPRLYIFVKMSLCTGARVSTLVRVHADDIKPDGSVRLYNTKLERYYTGFFDEETMELIKDRDGYVLARRGKQNKMPSVQSVQRPLLKIIHELFDDENTPYEMKACLHTLRHAVATQMISKGVPMEVVAKTLDHSNAHTTYQYYAKVAPELVRGSVLGIWD